MSRIQSREFAMNIIYSKMFTLDVKNVIEKYDDIDNDFYDIDSPADLEYTAKLLFAYAHNYDDINNLVSENLKDYTIEKLFRIDLAILFIAITELYYIEETPIKIVINEAVEMAKKFSTEKSYKFVNGFLANLIKVKPPKEVVLEKKIEQKDNKTQLNKEKAPEKSEIIVKKKTTQKLERK
ncbi:MAG: transcription antitermination factor NusB [Clostridia bacterium]|nr:transcription antitermination factor NusB [Clostridia bacterium]